VCSELLEAGRCEEGEMNRTLAVWGYSVVLRRCVPFYFTGCQAQTVKEETLKGHLLYKLMGGFLKGLRHETELKYFDKHE
jgi:hypothetical protein